MLCPSPSESVLTMPRTLRTAKRMPDPEQTPRLSEIARCLQCRAGLNGHDVCPGCGRSYPESGGILHAMAPLTGRNRIAQAFYDGPGWSKFRRWERLFLRVQGGESRARRQILRHLDAPPFSRVLEVGHRRWREPRALAQGLDGVRGRHRPETAGRMPRSRPSDGRPTGQGRGRGPAVRRRDLRRLLDPGRLQLLPRPRGRSPRDANESPALAAP